MAVEVFLPQLQDVHKLKLLTEGLQLNPKGLTSCPEAQQPLFIVCNIKRITVQGLHAHNVEDLLARALVSILFGVPLRIYHEVLLFAFD